MSKKLTLKEVEKLNLILSEDNMFSNALAELSADAQKVAITKIATDKLFQIIESESVELPLITSIKIEGMVKTIVEMLLENASLDCVLRYSMKQVAFIRYSENLTEKELNTIVNQIYIEDYKLYKVRNETLFS